MLRVALGLTAILLTGVVSVGSAAANEAKTIRIEPRAFYGATVSLESGVRVFRPLPRTTHVIVNPNKTPLKFTFKDVKNRITNTTNNFETVDRGFRRFGTFGIGSRKFRRFGRGGRGQRVGGSSGLRLSR